MSLKKYGSQLIKIGKMMKNPDTKIEELMKACWDAGLIIEFRVSPSDQVEIHVEDKGGK